MEVLLDVGRFTSVWMVKRALIFISALVFLWIEMLLLLGDEIVQKDDAQGQAAPHFISSDGGVELAGFQFQH